MTLPGACPNGPFCIGTGDRTVYSYVSFPLCFENVPTVSLGYKWLDIGVSGPANTVLKLDAFDIQKCGFNAVWSTWNDFRVSHAVAHWTAFESFKV